MIEVLEQARDIIDRRWRNTRGGWRVLLFIGIIIMSILGIVGLAIWFLGKLVKSLTVGGFRNRDLYIPRMRYRR